MSEADIWPIGEKIALENYPCSEVIGVDRYSLRALDGATRHWASYTLKSDAAHPFDRWWIVDLPERGLHAFYSSDSYAPTLPVVRELSGLVALASDGDADLSDELGALFMHEKQDGTFVTREIFPRSQTLSFEGRKVDAGK